MSGIEIRANLKVDDQRLDDDRVVEHPDVVVDADELTASGWTRSKSVNDMTSEAIIGPAVNSSEPDEPRADEDEAPHRLADGRPAEPAESPAGRGSTGCGSASVDSVMRCSAPWTVGQDVDSSPPGGRETRPGGVEEEMLLAGVEDALQGRLQRRPARRRCRPRRSCGTCSGRPATRPWTWRSRAPRPGGWGRPGTPSIAFGTAQSSSMPGNCSLMVSKNACCRAGSAGRAP